MTAVAATIEADNDLIVRRERAAGVIVLNRPKALNALTLEMTRGIAAALDDFENDPDVALVILEGAGERGLCAGGDIRGLYDSAKVGGDLGPIFWREEYILNARIASYAKPYVAYMDGLVMGGGVGLAAHGMHRIVTEKTRVAMPEVGIGFFPDVGGTWLLSRAPGELGTYLGLTAQPMNGADAINCGFADQLIASADWTELRAALCKMPVHVSDEHVGAVIGAYAAPLVPGPVTQQQGAIDGWFGFETMDEIVAALARDSSEFAQVTLKELQTKSPTSLKVTLKLMRLARAAKSLEECLVREYDAALEFFVSRDFVEGIRAAIIEKDRKPKWSPLRLEDVTPEIAERYFKRRDLALAFQK